MSGFDLFKLSIKITLVPDLNDFKAEESNSEIFQFILYKYSNVYSYNTPQIQTKVGSKLS